MNVAGCWVGSDHGIGRGRACWIEVSLEEVVPRFRVVCPEGDWTVFVPLPDDVSERERRMKLLSGFMAWKSATAFVVSSELIEPDVKLTAAVTRGDVACASTNYYPEAAWRRSNREDAAGSVGDEIIARCRAGVSSWMRRQRQRWCGRLGLVGSLRRGNHKPLRDLISREMRDV